MSLAVAEPVARSARFSPVGRVAAAAATAGAGLVHLAVVPEHWREYLPFGLFFLVVGAAQLLASAARPTRRTQLGVALGQVALVALWLVSRTSGLPVGPEPWQPEEIGVADVVCVALECAVGPAAGGSRGARGPAAAPPPGPHAVGRHRRGGRRRGRDVRRRRDRPVRDAGGVLRGATGGRPGGDVGDRAGRGTRARSRCAPSPSPPRRRRSRAAPPSPTTGRCPAPQLRVTQGDRVRVTLVNRLPVATTLHWHGIRVPNAEDGVAGITQDAVAPGASFTYEFVAQDAGTFWYHSHQDTGNQIPAGLFGALVVDPPGGPAPGVLDRTALLHNAVDRAADGPAIAVNGTTGDEHVDARPGQRVRLRVVDAVAPSMDGTAEAPILLGAPYRVVALDGHDLVGPTELGPRRLELGMGQRVDLEFTMPPTGSVRLVDSRVEGERSLLQGFFGASARAAETVTFGDGQAPAPPDPAAVPLFDPLTYGRAVADPTTRAPDLTAPVVLGEGPGFHDGAVQLVHTINGAASPAVPPLVVRQGQLVRLHFVNDTGEFHPMHLHGHVMTVLAVDGRAPTGSPLHLDTVLLAPHATADVAFPADNPGLWMLHCHVLLHAQMGMSMTIDYAGITTPFTMGARSGNTPE